MRLYGVAAATAVRSLSRLRGRAGVGVPPQMRWLRTSPTRALFERVDLPRKRER